MSGLQWTKLWCVVNVPWDKHHFYECSITVNVHISREVLQQSYEFSNWVKAEVGSLRGDYVL